MGVEETLLMGRGNRMERAPAEPWRQAVEQSETRVRPRLAFMTDEHRLAREAAVLVRSDAGDVSWAFPVTLDRTPHRLAFDSGERLYAA